MVRSLILVSFGAAFLVQAYDQRDALDPEFQKVPFERWITAGGTDVHDQGGPFHWSVSVPHAELTFHQRLLSRVEITLDGKDMETRRHHGSLLVLVQITDRDGTRYQDHYSMEVDKLDENVKASNLEYSFSAFFLPGEYKASVALVDMGTDEHSFTQVKFRVATPKHELPDAWRDLPSVEFIGDKVSPDTWYLPSVHGRLRWAAAVAVPVRLNVILNVAPAAPVPGSRSSSSRDLSALLPTLKAISQTGSSSVTERVEVLDLARRRAVFQQVDGQDLDWPRLRVSLGEANTASIDVHSLSEQHHEAQFFVSQVRSAIRDSSGTCVVVVLTKSVTFASGEDLQQISLEGLPACRVFYIRYHMGMGPFPPASGPLMGGRGRGMRMDGPMGRNRLSLDMVDELEATLKPLSPKVFDVETPEQVTKAMTEIEKVL